MKYNYPGLSDNAVFESRKNHGANVITTQDVEGFYGKLISNLKRVTNFKRIENKVNFSFRTQ